jgi:hypothetical protein
MVCARARLLCVGVRAVYAYLPFPSSLSFPHNQSLFLSVFLFLFLVFVNEAENDNYKNIV